jgi:hypothetical protein
MNDNDAAEERPAGLKIDGRFYEMPADFTIQEARVMKEISNGATPQDIIVGLRVDPSDPDLVAAVVWCVLHRADDKVAADDPRIGNVLIGDMWGDGDDEEEAPGDGNPPPSTSRPGSSSRAARTSKS